MTALFTGGESSLRAEPAPQQEPQKGAPTAVPSKTGGDTNALIAAAARDIADYQRLTAEGKLGEAGQKLEQLKQKLDQLAARQR